MERLCRSVLNPFAARGQCDDYDEQLAELISAAWELGLLDDEGREAERNYPAYAAYILKRRLHDRARRRGRTRWVFKNSVPPPGSTEPAPWVHTRPRPLPPLSLDAPAGEEGGVPLGETLAGGPGGDPADRAAAFGGLLGAGGGHEARDLAILRQGVEGVAA